MKLDFITFGVSLDESLLLRAFEALSDLRSLGDLELRSAWLYYGSIAAASKSFGVSTHAYRKSLNQRPRRLGWKLQKFSAMSEDELGLIIEGSEMIVEMHCSEREALFPTRARPTITKGQYITKIESWRRTQSDQWVAGYGFKSLPVRSAKELVEAYERGQQWLLNAYRNDREDWQIKLLVRNLYEVRLNRQLQNAIKIKDRLRDAARDSNLCSIALDIICEYETYCSQRAEILKHKKAQSRIIDSRREEFRFALNKRDGWFCKECQTVEDLQIDHIKALTMGGFSSFKNLQLLCGFCNNRKSGRSMKYLRRRKQRRLRVSLAI